MNQHPISQLSLFGCLLFVLFFSGMMAPIFAIAQPENQRLQVEIAQVELQGESISFDVLLKATTEQREYLGFLDVVFRFENTVLSPNASISLVPGSSQLFTGEGDQTFAYEEKFDLKIVRKKEVYVYIGTEPPPFNSLEAFIATVAHIDNQAGIYRLGRFSLTGVLQAPEELLPHTAKSGLRTQAYTFLPNQKFKANRIELAVVGCSLEKQLLELFELKKNQEQVNIIWRQGELAKWKAVFIERSYDLQAWEEIGFVPVDVKSTTDRPNPPAALFGESLVYYRMHIKPNKGKDYYSPIRVVGFSD